MRTLRPYLIAILFALFAFISLQAMHSNIAKRPENTNDNTQIDIPRELSETEAYLKTAELKYPTDYTITYQRAKIAGSRPTAHNEVFQLLVSAARKAIESGRADEMLTQLMKDESTDFRRLSRGHGEWVTIIEALRTKDELKLHN